MLAIAFIVPGWQSRNCHHRSAIRVQRVLSLPVAFFSFSALAIQGAPDVDRISTSHVEKQNHTLQMHCRRLTRLTNAFSKKFENFQAAVALNFAYDNFVKTHGALKMTPAMAAGIERAIGQL